MLGRVATIDRPGDDRNCIGRNIVFVDPNDHTGSHVDSYLGAADTYLHDVARANRGGLSGESADLISGGTGGDRHGHRTRYRRPFRFGGRWNHRWDSPARKCRLRSCGSDRATSRR